jgi:hypothetical protein
LSYSTVTTYFVVFVNVILFAPEKVKVTNPPPEETEEARTASEIAKAEPVGILFVPKVPE